MRNYNQSSQNNAGSSRPLEERFDDFVVKMRISITENSNEAVIKIVTRLAENIAEQRAEKIKLPSRNLPNSKGSVNTLMWCT